MSSQQAWEIANKYSSDLLVKYVIELAVIQVILYLIFGRLVALLGMLGIWGTDDNYDYFSDRTDIKKERFLIALSVACNYAFITFLQSLFEARALNPHYSQEHCSSWNK